MSVAPFRHALEWPACGSLRKCRRLTQHLFNPPNPHKQTVRCLDGKEGRSPPPSPRPASERIRNCSNSAPSRLSKASIRTVLTETLVQEINVNLIKASNQLNHDLIHCIMPQSNENEGDVKWKKKKKKGGGNEENNQSKPKVLSMQSNNWKPMSVPWKSINNWIMIRFVSSFRKTGKVEVEASEMIGKKAEGKRRRREIKQTWNHFYKIGNQCQSHRINNRLNNALIHEKREDERGTRRQRIILNRKNQLCPGRKQLEPGGGCFRTNNTLTRNSKQSQYNINSTSRPD